MIPAPALCQQWAITLDSQPRRIAADGRSTAQITAVVSSPGTGPAPEGTEVRFNTTAGSIMPVARVTGGKASAVLTSGATPSIAQITAIVGSSSATTEVEFVSGDFQAAEVMLAVQGDLAYSIDEGLLVADHATLSHGDLHISADTLEFDERRGQVRAQGSVTAAKGESTISADALWYSPEDQAGAVLIAGRSPVQVGFRANTLGIQTPQPATDQRAFEPFRPTHSRSWITAERAVIWPRERIQFTHATVTQDNRPVLSLPHYFYDYKGNTLNPISQQFRYTSYEGVVLDLPFYFQFREQSSAGVRLRYAGRGSSYGGFVTPRKGISLGLEQMYNTSGGGGRVFVDSFATQTRSFEWNHNQTASGGRRLTGSLRYQPLSDYSSNALSGFGSYAFSAHQVDLTAALYGNRSKARGNVTSQSSTGSLTTRLDARTRGRAIGSTGLSWRASGALVRGPLGSNGAGGLETGFYQTLGLGVARRPIPLVAGTSLTLDSSLERTFGAAAGTSLRGRAILSRPLGQYGDASLTWDQEFSGGRNVSSPYRKSLMGSLTAGKPEGLHGYAYLSWLPDDNSTNYQLSAYQPLGKLWRLEYTHNFNKVTFDDSLGDISASRFGYSRLSLVRPLGLFDVSLSWSPQGRDYGLKRGQKFWLEFGSRSF